MRSLRAFGGACLVVSVVAGCTPPDLSGPTARPAAPRAVGPAFDYPWGLSETDFGTLGGTRAGFNGADFDGDAVGWLVDASGRQRAVYCVLGNFWRDRTCKELGTLPGGSRSEAISIANDRIVGNSETASGATHAVLWTEDPAGGWKVTDLGTLGGENSVATRINALGYVIGASQVSTGEWHGYLRSPGKSLTDLIGNDKGWNIIPLGLSETDSLAVGYRAGGPGELHQAAYVKKWCLYVPLCDPAKPFQARLVGSFPYDTHLTGISDDVMSASLARGYQHFLSYYVAVGSTTWKQVPVDQFESVGIGYGKVIAGRWMCGTWPTGCRSLLWRAESNVTQELAPGKMNVTVRSIRGLYSAGSYLVNNTSHAVLWWYGPPVGVQP